MDRSRSWQQRGVEDVMSSFLMSPEAIVHLQQRKLDERRTRTDQCFRLTMEMIRTGEYFRAALKNLSARRSEVSL